MKDKTIIVDTGFYTKTVNKEQFIKRWLEHTEEVKKIVDYTNDEQVKKIVRFGMFVEELAEKYFEKTYARQNKKEVA
tara:strand:- start:7605 stop:7835 length:231 start_codon:yes stop_codon:yes gene_type:complete